MLGCCHPTLKLSISTSWVSYWLSNTFLLGKIRSIQRQNPGRSSRKPEVIGMQRGFNTESWDPIGASQLERNWHRSKVIRIQQLGSNLTVRKVFVMQIGWVQLASLFLLFRFSHFKMLLFHITIKVDPLPWWFQLSKLILNWNQRDFN